MKKPAFALKHLLKAVLLCGVTSLTQQISAQQTLAFPEATGFGRYTTGARGATNPQVYLVTNLNDSGAGSFRDAVSQPGRFVIFKVGGIINLQSQIVVSPNTTIAGQTATGEGIVLLGPRVTFTGASNTIARYLRIRYGGTSQNQDASGLSNGANMIFDHMTFTWGTDEVFSINWDNKGLSPDNITIQNSIIGQGLHRHNHSAGGLIQPADGKVSLIGNLYICNKTRNNKIKGINEFVNNVVYNWGNYGNTYGHTESGDAYIMGGDSAGRSDVNIINNYFIGGPNTSSTVSTPFNRGNDNFSLYGAGNFFDNNKDGVLNGTEVPQDLTGYPTGDIATLLSTPYDYPMKAPSLSAQAAFDQIVASVGASYPRRDQVDQLMVNDLMSKGTTATYVYVQSDLTSKFGFSNGGAGHVYGAPAPLDTDNDGMPDSWEDANGLNKNVNDAVNVSATQAPYLNIEVYINGLTSQTPTDFIIPPTDITFSNSVSNETPPSSSFTVNWGDNATNETNYVLERSTNGTDFTIIATLNANMERYDETGLTPNTQYYYRVKAINATESSVYTKTATITTAPIPTAPAKTTTPFPATANTNVELSNGTTVLKWSGSANTTSYSVYFGTDAAHLNKLADVPYVANASYSVSNVLAATNYFWRVDATNEKGTATGDVWTFSTLTPALVGHWPFQETALQGEQIADVSANANNGLLDVAYDNETTRVSGKVNNAISFINGPTNTPMVKIPNQEYLFFDTNSFTLSFWMKADASLLPASSSISAYILCKGSMTKNTTTGATGKRFNLEVKGGLLRFAIDDDKTKKELTTAVTPYFSGNWVHVVLMRDMINRKLKLYTNGSFTAELDESAVTGIGEPTDLVIGNIGELELAAGTTPAPYKGLFDELKIYNYPLEAPQIQALFADVLLSNTKFTDKADVIKVYPNPVSETIFVTVPQSSMAVVQATVFDLSGKIVLSQKINPQDNGHLRIDIANKNLSGIYILNVVGENFNQNFKIIIK
ncbi:LamG-like jellyroll fold domain-containing protein [Flavobacterium agrisoli]|uniref:Probable pectate lyase C n=1 Tax=Flavobacterium agrisoli TaxID=2793066 RepID=A0A934PM15_9FLAO|nr:LamG-like jellyroll fold domain-containing protein [Flavobacterium agrisoli]MBK0369305.1 T9SS type A sorting domain-containing protein [Flavobacterium agrisoli]